ncbi:hypothetical protein [Streptomyces dangxiongensis]|uniref:hypothetical protein n=1 Tax=Streptomyces dangxiongensis TaxID=1442032 RepID=UPI0013CED0D2
MWDQHDRPPTHLRGHRRGRDALISDLFAHPLKDPFGDSKFVSLGPHLRQLLGQLFFEFIQFRNQRTVRLCQTIYSADSRPRPA